MYSNETRIYFAIITGLFIIITVITFLIVTIIRFQKRKIAGYIESTKAGFNSLEEERQRIATDLHDDLGSSLSVIKLKLQCLDLEREDNIAIIQEAESSIDEAMSKLRNISFNIMPQVLNRHGLAEALNELIDVLTFTTKIKVKYNYTATISNKQTSIHIYRICQEIMNNVIRHSKADFVNFSIRKNKDKIEIHIADNGIGFDKDLITGESTGQGVRNIMSRAELLHAKVFLTTKRNSGTDYLIKIPDVYE